MSLSKVFKGVVFVMNNLEQEGSIAEEELDLVRVDGLKLLGYILNDLIELGDLVALLLQHACINLLLKKLSPEA